MSPVSTVVSLTRAEYEPLERRGTAGTVPALDDAAVTDPWRAAHNGWRGRYWAFLGDETGVLRLHPVNVTRAADQAAA
ncbi:hypothetical protein [Nocardia nova]|uniref:hypothetical protein n=1 Tax=Nocardia nova TaxID=37330 RepID=UPI0033EDE71F